VVNSGKSKAQQFTRVYKSSLPDGNVWGDHVLKSEGQFYLEAFFASSLGWTLGKGVHL